MVYERYGYSAPHSHPGAHWSAVYFVSGGKVGQGKEKGGPRAAVRTDASGGADRAGYLEFINTHTNSDAIPSIQTRPTLRIEPRAGLMVAFPSWVPHFVHPHDDDSLRISIACNATMHMRQDAGA